MNKFFINKLNGIKRNVIASSLLVIMGIGLLSFGSKQTVVAANDGNQSYTQTFQNPTTTLSGKSVQTSMYFSKIDYWNLKGAIFSFNFQISQLANTQSSDITLSLNGVKFYSFRPNNISGIQTKQVVLPLSLIQGNNTLKISGQVINNIGATAKTIQTPANWLSINSGSNVNFSFNLDDATARINSFYSHFTGMDTIAAHRASIVVPKTPTNSELTAAVTSLSGLARFITTTDTNLPILKIGNESLDDVDYQLIIAKYENLPAKFKQQISEKKSATIKSLISGSKHYLVVTAPTDKLLKKAAQFVANQELMQETKSETKKVTNDTQTFTSVLQYQGNRILTQTPTMLTGSGQQSVDYFISLPTDRTNADGSSIKLHYRYAKNLNFKRALVSIKVNGQLIGSQKLSLRKADNDNLIIKLPKGIALGNTFTVSLTFDLETYDQATSDNDQTPWAIVESDSTARIKSKKNDKLLFSNFPSTFINDGSLNNLVVVRPKKMTDDDLATLTNIFNMFGNYVQQNTGEISVYSGLPSNSVLKNSSIVAFGSPKKNKLIDSLNDKLYFKYNQQRDGFLSNEKLSIESEFGKTVGTNQLLRSPYNDRNALLVVTGPTANTTLLASTKISTQSAISQFKGDGVLVDPDNTDYSYRFKKVADLNGQVTTQKFINDNSKIIIYLVFATVTFGLILLALFLIIRKNIRGKGSKDEE